ncbi:rhodanese-like domain-containing protein [Desulfosoma caldarium]|uniref:rhodanese-like domain-containing protein n=1 Tax=Desulfosoma caldarium TaxID=610254 RepID=UPI000F499E2D|nr:rhodanese-like domain-containing protein [Desulfosoma caldarium]
MDGRFDFVIGQVYDGVSGDRGFIRVRIKKIIFLSLVALISGECVVFAMKDGASMDSIKAMLFVETSWLTQNLCKVIVVDARPEKHYNNGHLPGAASVPWQSFADMRGKPRHPRWGVLLPQEQLSPKLGALGIDGETPLVVYAQPSGWGEDGRFAWMALKAGIRNVKILDGGYKAWKDVSSGWFEAGR